LRRRFGEVSSPSMPVRAAEISGCAGRPPTKTAGRAADGVGLGLHRDLAARHRLPFRPSSGNIGVPIPGTELKLVPSGKNSRCACAVPM
jgi:hypothetical protein